MQKLIQFGQIQSDVNPEIHTLEKKLKAFEQFGIGELAFYNHKSLPINSFNNVSTSSTRSQISSTSSTSLSRGH